MERQYTRTLRRIWGVAQDIIAIGLEPLIEVWPSEEDDRTDARAPRRRISPLVSAYPFSGRREYPRRPPPGPLSPRSARLPRIWQLTDTELLRLWPGLDPEDIRQFAPWAVSRDEVTRLAFPGGSESPSPGDLEARVSAAITAERRARPRAALPVVRTVERRRPVGAFRPRRVNLPFVFTPGGAPLVPPRPSRLSPVIIRKQIDWIQLGLETVFTPENINPAIDPLAQRVADHTHRDVSRVMAIDVRRDVPGLDGMIAKWREVNVDLIESGIMAPHAKAPLRPGLLADVSRTIEQAHANGIRVEVLAGELTKRFNVSASRAELIARDQTLKLNGQITRHRQTQIGVREYRWITSRDERVRERHAELDGTIQSWDAPPEVGEGQHEHPGGAINCRCTASPIVPAWLDAD